MKRVLWVLCAAFALLTMLSGCDFFSSEPESSEPPAPPLLTEEEARTKAAGYYPAGVEAVFYKLEEIDGKNCFVFNVTRIGDTRVLHQSAVAAAGDSVWFKPGDDVNAAWTPEIRLGDFPANTVPLTPTAPYFEPIPSQNEGEISAYFMNLVELAPLGEPNEGIATWNADTQTLFLTLTKITGSRDGASAGPSVEAAVTWAAGAPAVESKMLLPAPLFLNPGEVLGSLEEPVLDDAALLDIAVFIRAQLEATAPTLNFQF